MTKIYSGRDYLGRFTCDGRRYTRLQLLKIKAWRLFKKVILVVIVIDALGWASVAGYHYAIGNVIPETVFAEKVIKYKAPVLDKIAMCESGNSHYDKKTGQVLMRSNTNKTVDIGKYQINSIWNKKATELGLDLTKEKDNEEMAYWLYANRGTGDWKYSAECWQR